MNCEKKGVITRGDFNPSVHHEIALLFPLLWWEKGRVRGAIF
jgi:hypothetical protein